MPKHAGPAAVSDADFEVGAGVEDAAEDQGRDDQRVLDDDAQVVGEAEAVGLFEEQIVLGLRVKEQDRAHGFGGFEERPEARLVPARAVHHGVELGALEAEHVHRALELVDRRADVLHRQGGEPREAPGPVARHGGDLVVDLAREPAALRGLEVVAEERRVDRDHLRVDTLSVHVAQTLFGRESHLEVRDAALPSVRHRGAETLAGLEARPVPGLSGVDGAPQTLRHQVRVDVDGAHRCFFYHTFGPAIRRSRSAPSGSGSARLSHYRPPHTVRSLSDLQ